MHQFVDEASNSQRLATHENIVPFVGVCMGEQTGLIYQNLRDIHSVAAVDVIARSVRERWDLAGCIEPSGMALDDANRRLFIACGGSASVSSKRSRRASRRW